jgi:DNA helicase HerA-like ATPase
MGIVFCVGTTGTGKTTLAYELAVKSAGERACPLIIVDSAGVMRAEGAVKIESPDASQEDETFKRIVETVWGSGHHVIYEPRDEADANRLFEAIRAGGNVVLLIDEASYWARGNSASPALLRLSRVHRHSGVDIFVTTQYPADLNPLLWNCKSEVYIFRNPSSASLERLEDECYLTEEELEEVRTLPNYEYRKWEGGHGVTPKPAAPPAEAPPVRRPDQPPGPVQS